MNWVDLVVLGVILISGLLAFARGFVRESLGLGAWVAAVAAAIAAQPFVQPWARQQFADQALADTVALVAVFVVVLILLSLIASAAAGAVRDSVLGGVDRTLGLLFGLARGVVLVCGAYIVVGLAVAVDQWPPPVLNARSLPYVYRGADWIVAHVPTEYRPALAAPPAGRTTTAELMRVGGSLVAAR
jgi:membrane protein required for colicin V production